MNNNKYQICIVGAGVVGLAIARKLSGYYESILVIEKESSFGHHISSRNSEVIHSGFYYPTNSLKAKLCYKGNKMLYEFSKKYNIRYKKCGKLIVIHDKKDFGKLERLKKQAESNGIRGMKILSKEESIQIEPRIKCLNSLWVPSAGIIDSHGLMSKLENLAINNGVDFTYNNELLSIKKNNDHYKLIFTNDYIFSDIVINCGGLWSDEISKKNNLNNYELGYYKGDYYKSKTIKNLNCLIYPLPQPRSLGVHAVINLSGEVSFGPNIYKVNSIDYSINDKYKKQYLNEIRKYINVKENDIFEDFSGIRPKLGDISTFNDFLIKNEVESKNKNFINLIGIDSPGLTSSLAIADYVDSIII